MEADAERLLQEARAAAADLARQAAELRESRKTARSEKKLSKQRTKCDGDAKVLFRERKCNKAEMFDQALERIEAQAMAKEQRAEAMLGQAQREADAKTAEAALKRKSRGVLETRALAEGGASLFPDAAPTLEALRRAGFGLALVSNCGPVYFAACLEHLGLAAWFDFTACLGDRPTKAANVAAALDRLGTRTGVMVGDRRSDIEAGRANGLRTVGVLHGYGTATELADADARLRGLSGLPELARELLLGLK